MIWITDPLPPAWYSEGLAEFLPGLYLWEVAVSSETAGGEHGPSWYDVEQMHAYLQTAHDVGIVYEATCTLSRSTGRYGWWVRACARPPKRLGLPNIAVGAYAFRGNGGARTYTAALYQALLDLQDGLDGPRGEAKRLPGF